MIRLIAIAVVIAGLGIATVHAQANPDPAVVKRQEALLYKRTDVQNQIQNIERQLRQLDMDRKDKLEELAELYRAHADLDKRHAFSKDIEIEIASQTRNLNGIERHRSDCLEELDLLYRGLTQINRDVADCSKQLH